VLGCTEAFGRPSGLLAGAALRASCGGWSRSARPTSPVPGRRVRRRYIEFLRQVAAREQERAPGQTRIAEAVARHLYKLMRTRTSTKSLGCSCAKGGPGDPQAVREWRPRLLALHPRFCVAGMKRKLKLGRWAGRAASPALASQAARHGARPFRTDGGAQGRARAHWRVPRPRAALLETLSRPPATRRGRSPSCPTVAATNRSSYATWRASASRRPRSRPRRANAPHVALSAGRAQV